MASFKKFVAPNGLPGWRVMAGANCLGSIFNVEPGDHPIPHTWHGVAPDGTRFGARSKPKIVQRLQIHAAYGRAA